MWLRTYKKWGTKVEDINIPGINGTVHSVKMTTEMKESAMEGQLMFAKKKRFSSDNDEFNHKLKRAVDEKGIVVNGIDERELEVVPIESSHPFNEKLPDAELKKQVKNYAKAYGLTGLAYCDGIPINVSLTSVGEMVDPKAIGNSVDKT